MEDIMNHNRRPLTSRTRKKMEKEVRKGQELLTTPREPNSDEITAEQLLKKYPAKTQKRELPTLRKFQNQSTPKKRKKILSKRTTPGEVMTRDSSPKIVHLEEARWEKTVNLQNVIQSKGLKAKLLKRQRKK